ncbi:hypothetical protein [Halorhabdus rudnickae]|uniref:hypothetical protein n=1 Tax=Halorhabdus rudnickae TaxID=1775544 RepID=UPI001FCF0067|nr:hypothetical protein [Halorhabdus rudnickae]
MSARTTGTVPPGERESHGGNRTRTSQTNGKSHQTVFNLTQDTSWTVVNVIGADELSRRSVRQLNGYHDGIDNRGNWQVISNPTDDVALSIVRDTTKFSAIETRQFRRDLQETLVDELGKTEVLRFSMSDEYDAEIMAQMITYISDTKSVEGEHWAGVRAQSDESFGVWLACDPGNRRQLTLSEAEPYLETIAEDTGIEPHFWDNDAGDITPGHYPDALDREIIDA